MSELKDFIESHATKPLDWNAAPEIVLAAIQMDEFASICKPQK